MSRYTRSWPRCFLAERSLCRNDRCHSRSHSGHSSIDQDRIGHRPSRQGLPCNNIQWPSRKERLKLYIRYEARCHLHLRLAMTTNRRASPPPTPRLRTCSRSTDQLKVFAVARAIVRLQDLSSPRSLYRTSSPILLLEEK